MAQRSSDNIGTFLLVGLVLLVGISLLIPGIRDIVVKISHSVIDIQSREFPRNENPMDEFTHYFEKHDIPVGKRTYTYYWYQPEKPWPEGLKFPLVLLLHDGPGRIYAARYLITDELAHKYPAFLFIPILAAKRQWSMPPEEAGPGGQTALGEMIEAVKTLASLYPIDMTRIYIAGCSDGGTGVYGAARFFPDFFAAGVAMSGSWNPADGVNMTKMPLLTLHSRYDTVIPPEQVRALSEIIRSRGGEAYYNEFPDMGHDCSSPYLYSEDVWKWLFSKKL